MRWVADSPDSNTRIVAVVAMKKERTINSYAPLMAPTVRDISNLHGGIPHSRDSLDIGLHTKSQTTTKDIQDSQPVFLRP